MKFVIVHLINLIIYIPMLIYIWFISTNFYDILHAGIIVFCIYSVVLVFGISFIKVNKFLNIEVKDILTIINDKKIGKGKCTTCRFNNGKYGNCTVGTYYADKGLNRKCNEGELWQQNNICAFCEQKLYKNDMVIKQGNSFIHADGECIDKYTKDYSIGLSNYTIMRYK